MSDSNTDVTTALRSIGIRLNSVALQQLLDDMTALQLTPSDVCGRIAAAETAERARRNHARRQATAALGNMHSIDQFDWQWPTIDKVLVDKLLKLDFIKQNENVLLRGPSGLGKTMLAKNLGWLALQHGMDVRFSTIAGMLTDIVKQDGVVALERRMRRYTQPDLLILDELGYVPHGAKGADHLFSVISQRHEVNSTIITTNLAYKKWGEVFDHAASIHAAVDRFAEHCHVVDIEGESYRQRKTPTRTKVTK